MKSFLLFAIIELSRQIQGIPIVCPPAPPVPVTALREGLAIHIDENNCCVSCGYSYCPSLDTCVRPWETKCREFDFPYNAFYENGIVLPEDGYYENKPKSDVLTREVPDEYHHTQDELPLPFPSSPSPS